jgi:hypothetical protein
MLLVILRKNVFSSSLEGHLPIMGPRKGEQLMVWMEMGFAE